MHFWWPYGLGFFNFFDFFVFFDRLIKLWREYVQDIGTIFALSKGGKKLATDLVDAVALLFGERVVKHKPSCSGLVQGAAKSAPLETADKLLIALGGCFEYQLPEVIVIPGTNVKRILGVVHFDKCIETILLSCLAHTVPALGPATPFQHHVREATAAKS